MKCLDEVNQLLLEVSPGYPEAPGIPLSESLFISGRCVDRDIAVIFDGHAPGLFSPFNHEGFFHSEDLLS